MFLAIVFIVIGIFLLLNAMGIVIAANFWGFFWAIVFLAAGVKMLISQGKCPICEGHMWGGKIHEKMHENCGCDDGECGNDCGCDCDCHDEEKK
jgi:hypothetical protein